MVTARLAEPVEMHAKGSSQACFAPRPRFDMTRTWRACAEIFMIITFTVGASVPSRADSTDLHRFLRSRRTQVAPCITGCRDALQGRRCTTRLARRHGDVLTGCPCTPRFSPTLSAEPNLFIKD